MEQGLKNRLYNYLSNWKTINPEKWIHKGELEELSKGAGYLAENCNRRLREMIATGIIEHRRAGKSQEYRSNF